ncbi:MAG: ribosome maturation factor RimM [Methylovirgula sp.]
MSKERILVGQFGAAHGVKGELRLKSFTQDPSAIGRYGRLSDASGGRSFEIAALRPLKDDLFVAKVVGIATREAAEKLTNVALYVGRETLPAAEEDEFYHADLIGLAAQTQDGIVLGRIAEILNFGGGDILEIAPEAGGETLLVPFTKAAAPVIDVANGFVIVVPPAETDTDTDSPSPCGEGSGAGGEAPTDGDDPHPGPHSPPFTTGVENDALRRSDPPHKGEGKGVT